MKSPRNQKLRLVLSLLFCFITACAQSGHDPNESKIQKPKEKTEDQSDDKKNGKDQNFSSAFLTADTTLSIPTLGCRKPISKVKYPKVPEQLVLDSNLNEWSDRQLLFADQEVSSINFSVGNIYGGINEQILSLAGVLHAPLTSYLYIEFGGARIKDNVVALEKTLTLRTDGIDLQEFTKTWSSISPSLFTIVKSDASFELALSRKYVGEAVNWPVWWIRVYDTSSPYQPYRSSARFYEKMLESNSEEIGLNSCEDWGGKSSGQIFF